MKTATNKNQQNRSRSHQNKKSPSPGKKQSKYVISNQTEVHDSPTVNQKSKASFGVYESVQVDILPDEGMKSPNKERKENQLNSPSNNQDRQNNENDDSNDTYIMQPPHKTFRKFSPQRKIRTISRHQNRSSMNTINNTTNEINQNPTDSYQVPSKIEHTQTVISPVRKDEENFLKAQKFDTGYLQRISDSNDKNQQNNINSDDQFNEDEFNEEDFLSPQKLAPTQEVDDNESLSEFLQTEEKLKNEISSTKTKTQESVYEFIPYKQEKPKKTKKSAQVIPNYSKILKILRDFIPDVRRISLEMSKYKHEHMALLVSPKQNNPIVGIYTLDLDHQMLKKIWGSSTRAIVEENDIDTYYMYDQKKFIPLVDKRGQNTVNLSQDIEAFSC